MLFNVNLKTNLKKNVTTSSCFWKFRHYIDSKFIDSYDKKPTQKFLLDFASNKKISSVLDFGCSRGNFLY